MGTRDGLEAALLASWDRETLAVYADHLQAAGDPRGELIALDLQLDTRSTPELVARRTSLLSGWLGRLVPSNPHTPWVGDSFRFGFVDDLVLEADADAAMRLAQILASPLAAYLKRVTIRGDAAHVGEMLRGLAGDLSHSWLTDLSIYCWGEGPVDPEAIAAWIAVTPALARLDVRGHRVFEQFRHPAVRRLRITGSLAIPGVFDRDQPMTEVTELDLAFEQPYDAEHYGAPVAGAIRPLQLPALRVLDLSRNEPEAIRAYGAEYYGDDLGDDGDDERDPGTPTVLAMLASQPIRKRVTQLTLPSIRSREDFERLEQIASHMPALETIEIARAHYFKLPAALSTSKARLVKPAGWPWPPVAEIPEGDNLHVVVPGSRTGDTTPIRDAAAIMERRFEDLDVEARFAWTRFWAFVDELGKLPWKSDPTETWTDDRTFPATLLAAALETCEVGGSGGWRELRDSLRFRRPFAPDAMLVVRRVRTL